MGGAHILPQLFPTQAEHLMVQEKGVFNPDPNDVLLSADGMTDCPTSCPGPNDDSSLVACCSVGCHQESPSSCIRYCCNPETLRFPLHATPGLLGGLMLMGGLAVAIVVWCSLLYCTDRLRGWRAMGRRRLKWWTYV